MITKNIINLLFISFIVTNLFAIILISSQTTPPTPSGIPRTSAGGEIDPDTGLPKDVLPIVKAGDILSDEDKRTAYLKAEWEKILLKSETFGPWIRMLLRLDPVSKFLLGISINFSWYFFLTLVIFIAFIVIIFRVTTLFEISNKWVHFAIAMLVITAVNFYRYPKSIASVIIGLIVLFNQWWMQYVIVGIAILAIILATYFSKQIQIIWKAMKEKHKKEMEELEKNEFHRDIKLLEGFRKELSK